MLRLLPLVLLGLFSAVTAAETENTRPRAPQSQTVIPEPTLADQRYGDHERHVLDFWKADSSAPAPLVFVIHGGGWQGGDKNRVGRFVDVQQLLDHGISVAAINYRFVKHAVEAQAEPPVRIPLHDAAHALQYLRSRAQELNINPDLVGAAGGSAGACSSLWLAYHDDLAEPDAEDPIRRQSTRLYCAAVIGAQTTLDPQQMQEWTPNSRYGGHAFGLQGFSEFLAARDRIQPWIAEYSPWHLVSSEDPPVYLSYSAVPAPGKVQKDPTHTANFGVLLQERCRQQKVSCELAYPGAPDGMHASPTDFLIATLKQKRSADR